MAEEAAALEEEEAEAAVAALEAEVATAPTAAAVAKGGTFPLNSVLWGAPLARGAPFAADYGFFLLAALPS
eukprot:4756820-Prymnesium_polylepis.1